MGSTRCRVHLSEPHRPIFVSNSHHIIDILLVCHTNLSHVYYVDSFFFCLTDLKIGLCFIQQILNLFHVDFYHRHRHSEFHFRRGILDLIENVCDHTGNDSSFFFVVHVGAGHGVGFAGTCLAIRKNGSVKALHHTINNLSY